MKYLPCLLLLLFTGCKQDKGSFPEVKNLSAYPKTAFVITPQHTIDKNKNAVYSVSLLLAWQEIKGFGNGSIEINKKYSNLELLNNSTSYKKTLSEDEYTSSIDVDEDSQIIRASAAFSKSLPFLHEFDSYTDRLKFDGEKVASFGFYGAHHNLLSSMRILYYKNDDNFIVKLLPKDRTHEIILYKSTEDFKTFQQVFDAVSEKSAIGQKERKNEADEWKYYMKEDDELLIPKFSFNIENNYNELAENEFMINGKDFRVEEAYQRTAFILDEAGAKVESEAEIAVEEVFNKPKEKKLHFNKPFFVLLKKVKSPNPYFALYIDNTELFTPKK